MPPLCDYNNSSGGNNSGGPAMLMTVPGDAGGGGNSEVYNPPYPPFVWVYNPNDDEEEDIKDEFPSNKPTFQFLSSDNYETKYPRFTELVKNLKSFVMSNKKVLSALQKWSGLSQNKILEYLSFGNGPIIKISAISGALGYLQKF